MLTLTAPLLLAASSCDTLVGKMVLLQKKFAIRNQLCRRTACWNPENSNQDGPRQVYGDGVDIYNTEVDQVLREAYDNLGAESASKCQKSLWEAFVELSIEAEPYAEEPLPAEYIANLLHEKRSLATSYSAILSRFPDRCLSEFNRKLVAFLGCGDSEGARGPALTKIKECQSRNFPENLQNCIQR